MERTEKFNFLFPVSFAEVTEIIQGCCEVYFINVSICTEAAAVRTILKHCRRIPGSNANLCFKLQFK